MALDEQVIRHLDRVVAEHGLPEGAAQRLAAIVSRVATDPEAPTTVVEPDEVVASHVVGALDGLLLEEVRVAERIADLGSGAGFPGVVLAVALPRARVTLVESVARKSAFQRRVLLDAGLVDAVDVVTARAEAWPDGIGAHDVVVARALAPLGVLVEYAAPLLAPGGHLVAYKGRRDAGEEADAAAAGEATGLAPASITSIPRRPGASGHHLHLWSKVRATPARFPRRAGMARKRPLRASPGG